MRPIYKILIVGGIVLFGALVIYLGWRAITGPSQDDAAGGGIPSAPLGEPVSFGDVDGPVITQIGDTPAFDFWVHPDTGQVYYFTFDGMVFNAKRGPDLEISTRGVAALNFVSIGPGRAKVLAAFGDPGAPDWGIFDLIDGVWRPLPADIIYAAWGIDDEHLVAIVRDAGARALVGIDLRDLTAPYTVFINDFLFEDVRFTAVSPEKILIFERPSASYAARAWELDLSTAALTLMASAQSGFTAAASDDARIVFAFTPPNTFSILNSSFQNIAPVFFSTLPRKCEVDGPLVYCFVPRDVPDDVTLPDDYLQKRFFSTDDLFLVATDTGGLTKVFASDIGGLPALDGIRPQYLDGYVYFINRYDSILYRVLVDE